MSRNLLTRRSSIVAGPGGTIRDTFRRCNAPRIQPGDPFHP